MAQADGKEKKSDNDTAIADNLRSVDYVTRMTVNNQETIKNAAKGGNVDKFETVLKHVKFPMSIVGDLNGFMVYCEFMSIERSNERKQDELITAYEIDVFVDGAQNAKVGHFVDLSFYSLGGDEIVKQLKEEFRGCAFENSNNVSIFVNGSFLKLFEQRGVVDNRARPSIYAYSEKFHHTIGHYMNKIDARNKNGGVTFYVQASVDGALLVPLLLILIMLQAPPSHGGPVFVIVAAISVCHFVRGDLLFGIWNSLSIIMPNLC